MRIMRRGRHAPPSQIEKVAAQAGKAAPAAAIAGALVAVPTAQQASAATLPPATTTGARPVAHPASPAALDASVAVGAHTATTASTQRTYTVRGGDSLSLIAQHYYNKAADWQWLYHENASTISDPNLIYVGQRISVPFDPPANYTLPGGYQPRHAASATSTTAATTTASEASESETASASTGSSSSPDLGTSTLNRGTPPKSGGGWTAPSGLYSCSDLEHLWDAAGGNPGAAFIAAEIAMAESGGNPNALSPTDDYGLWQINASNGALATFNPFQNAKSAIILSSNGTDWSPWTTYTSGAYQGRC